MKYPVKDSLQKRGITLKTIVLVWNNPVLLAAWLKETLKQQ
jgi:hypothetical protein